MSCAKASLAAALIGLALMGGPARAEAPEPRAVRRPNGDDFARYYPLRAAVFEIEGKAALACTVAADGSLTDCRAEDESPAGYGFGAAVLKLAPAFQVTTAAEDGTSLVGKPYRVTIRFRLPPGPSPSPGQGMQVEPLDPANFPEMDQLIPPGARPAGVAESAMILSCRVGADRALRGCRIEGEAADGVDWRAPALTLAHGLRLKAAAPRQKGRFRLMVRFRKFPSGVMGFEVRPPPEASPRLEPRPGHEPALTLISALYPPRAWAARAGGEASVQCRVGRERALEACRAFGYGPDRWGFASAIYGITEHLRVIDRPGAPAEGETIRFTVYFMIGRDGSNARLVYD